MNFLRRSVFVLPINPHYGPSQTPDVLDFSNSVNLRGKPFFSADSTRKFTKLGMPLDGRSLRMAIRCLFVDFSAQSPGGSLAVYHCRSPWQTPTMGWNSIDEEKDKRSGLLRLRHEYGKTFNVFLPSEQPDPHNWDRPLTAPDNSGTIDPQALKHWRYFERTRGFLRQRYSEHGIPAGPTLVFDCLVPKFQKPLDIPPETRKQCNLPLKGDPPEWYTEELLMLLIIQEGIPSPSLWQEGYLTESSSWRLDKDLNRGVCRPFRR